MDALCNTWGVFFYGGKTRMTNYNDGKWHGWNGGECPVHPETVVDVVFDDGSKMSNMRSKGVFWKGALMPCAFRVVKEHRKSRDFWICIFDGSAWDNEATANRYNKDRGQVIHVREVIE